MIEKKAGSTIKYFFCVKNSSGAKIDITGYELNIKVINLDTGTTVITRAITSRTDDNLSFVVELSTVDTGTTMGVGSFNVCHLVTNDDPAYQDEAEEQIFILESCYS